MELEARAQLELKLARPVKGNQKGFCKHSSSNRRTKKKCGPAAQWGRCLAAKDMRCVRHKLLRYPVCSLPCFLLVKSALWPPRSLSQVVILGSEALPVIKGDWIKGPLKQIWHTQVHGTRWDTSEGAGQWRVGLMVVSPKGCGSWCSWCPEKGSCHAHI